MINSPNAQQTSDALNFKHFIFVFSFISLAQLPREFTTEIFWIL